MLFRGMSQQSAFISWQKETDLVFFFLLLHSYADVLENELGAEVENGRIVRLMTKLGFINERAEYVNFPFLPTTPPPPKHYSCFVETNRPWIRFELDPRWSDTGDRYILKLFRDYVFHSVGVDGKPILDLSHVLVCLNKVRLGVFCSSNNPSFSPLMTSILGGEKKETY